MTSPSDAALLRIGEFSRRIGVSDHTLRAWESRYGLLQPKRSDGGFRLYGPEDERRVRRMVELIDLGLPSSQAARIAIADPNGSGAPGLEAPAGGQLPTSVLTSSQAPADVPTPSVWVRARSQLRQTLEEFEDRGAHQVLDRLLADFALDNVMGEVVLPFLNELEARWEAGQITAAQHHFARNVLRGRLTGLARGWASGSGPRAVLLCPPGEFHDLPVVVFGIILNHGGWRVVFLGADTPIQGIDAGFVPPADLFVLAAASAEPFERQAKAIADLASRNLVVLAGPGATKELTERTGTILSTDDPVTAAQQVIAR